MGAAGSFMSETAQGEHAFIGREGAVRVVEVDTTRAREAADVLTQALLPYPTMRWVCRAERPGFEERLRAIYRVAIRMQLAEGQPTFGALVGERLAAVAIAHDPGRAMTARSALAGLLGSVLSPARSTMARGHRYESAIARVRPREPHHFLSVIGARPDARGRGYGRALMDALHARAGRDERSAGVCLDTCDAGNRRYYERFGYEERARCRTGPLEQWILFRPSR
jgi:GNAT superfamily N-acetyltransferase